MLSDFGAVAPLARSAKNPEVLLISMAFVKSIMSFGRAVLGMRHPQNIGRFKAETPASQLAGRQAGRQRISI